MLLRLTFIINTILVLISSNCNHRFIKYVFAMDDLFRNFNMAAKDVEKANTQFFNDIQQHFKPPNNPTLPLSPKAAVEQCKAQTEHLASSVIQAIANFATKCQRQCDPTISQADQESLPAQRLGHQSLNAMRKEIKEKTLWFY